MRKHYEILLFDADGTLLDFDRAEEAAFKEVLKYYGFAPEQAYLTEYHEINRECWEAFEEGRMERNQVLTSRFVRFFHNHERKVVGEEAEEFYRKYLDKGFYLIDGAADILAYLKERYTLYIVTNGIADTQRIRLSRSGLAPCFKDVFISEDVGSQKPQREFFDYCFKRIHEADSAKMLLIGDSLTSDIQGGVNAGVDTCWYNPSGAVNTKNIHPDYEIRSLDGLKEFL